MQRALVLPLLALAAGALAPAALAAPAARTPVKVYFLSPTKDSVTAVQRIPLARSGPATQAIRGLLAGPTTPERARGLRTAIPRATRLNHLSVAGGVATVDLTWHFNAPSSNPLALRRRMAQVVWTLTQFSTVAGVRFRLDGKPLSAQGKVEVPSDPVWRRPDVALGGEEPASAATGRIDVKAYYVQRGDIVHVKRSVLRDGLPITASVRAMLDGPTSTERSAGVMTYVPSGTKVRSITLSGGVATVDLTSVFESGAGLFPMQARLAQLVYTATQFGNATSVRLKLDGHGVTVFSDEGLLIDEPLTRDDVAF